jgi:hypothetical protein
MAGVKQQHVCIKFSFQCHRSFQNVNSSSTGEQTLKRMQAFVWLFKQQRNVTSAKSAECLGHPRRLIWSMKYWIQGKWHYDKINSIWKTSDCTTNVSCIYKAKYTIFIQAVTSNVNEWAHVSTGYYVNQQKSYEMSKLNYTLHVTDTFSVLRWCSLLQFVCVDADYLCCLNLMQ